MNFKIASAGQVIGLSSAVSGTPSQITGTTIEPTMVNVVRKDDFLNFIQTHVEGSIRAAAALANECRDTFADAKSLALSGSVAGRVAGLLLELGKEASMENGTAFRFNMSLTHEDLAEFTGASRETVTRALGRLQSDRLIQISGATVHILEPRKLAELVA